LSGDKAVNKSSSIDSIFHLLLLYLQGRCSVSLGFRLELRMTDCQH